MFIMLEDYLKSQSMRSLSLIVDFWNDKAEALYTKIGFRREQRHLMVKHIN